MHQIARDTHCNGAENGTQGVSCIITLNANGQGQSGPLQVPEEGPPVVEAWDATGQGG